MHISHEFSDPALLASATDRTDDEFQRLEWLGDSVLGCCVTMLLYRNHPQRSEADLSRIRARLVSNKQLCKVGLALRLPDRGASSGSASQLADMVESILGAIMLDGGMAAALQCVEDLYGDDLLNPPADLWSRDAKSQLKEYCERRQLSSPNYTHTTIDVSSDFVATCVALGTSSTGSGSSKLEAEIQAANKILTELGITATDEPVT